MLREAKLIRRWAVESLEHKRENIRCAVANVCRRHGIEIYGSFQTGLFHYDPVRQRSFSDVDGIFPDTGCPFSLRSLGVKVSEEIEGECGLRLPVHLRDKRIHHFVPDDPLPDEAAGFESLYQAMDKGDEGQALCAYLQAKLLLKTVWSHIYFSQPSDLTATLTTLGQKDRLLVLNVLSEKTHGTGAAFMLAAAKAKAEARGGSVQRIFHLLETQVSAAEVAHLWRQHESALNGEHQQTVRNDIVRKLNLGNWSDKAACRFAGNRRP